MARGAYHSSNLGEALVVQSFRFWVRIRLEWFRIPSAFTKHGGCKKVKRKGFYLGGLGGVVLIATVSLVLIAGASGKRAAITPIPSFSSGELAGTPKNDWIGVHGNTMNQQFSGLTEVTKDNV